MAWTRCGVVVMVLALGCGSSVPADDGGESTGDASSEGADTNAADTGPDCLPADPALAFEFELRGDFGTDCVVVAPVDDAAVSLECTTAAGTREVDSMLVDVTPPVAFDLGVGTAVELLYVEPDAEWDRPETSYIVRDVATGELLLALIDVRHGAWVDRLTPLVLTPIAGACAAGPDDSDCLTVERTMWTAQDTGASAVVGDGTRTQVGRYLVHIQRAGRGQLLECIDVDTNVYRALIVRTG